VSSSSFPMMSSDVIRLAPAIAYTVIMIAVGRSQFDDESFNFFVNFY
jgi:hypothetical protein